LRLTKSDFCVDRSFIHSFFSKGKAWDCTYSGIATVEVDRATRTVSTTTSSHFGNFFKPKKKWIWPTNGGMNAHDRAQKKCLRRSKSRSYLPIQSTEAQIISALSRAETAWVLDLPLQWLFLFVDGHCPLIVGMFFLIPLLLHPGLFHCDL
jgi:hypothetical protein